MLIICPTPIGNLDDITERQRQALGSADIIACEDTRRAGKLLSLLGIERVEGKPRLWRYDEHTESEGARRLVEKLEAGKQVVLTTDAGTPTISDPGYRVVRACRQRGIEVSALPGPVAAVVALSGSGLPTDRFVFEGFLPTSSKARQTRLEAMENVDATSVVYESPRRIVDALRDVEVVCGPEREVCVARELTKMHEEYLSGQAVDVRRQLQEQSPVRGEIVLCVGPGAKEDGGEDMWEEPDRAIALLHQQQLRSRTIKEFIDAMYDVPRSQIYDRIEQVIEEDGDSKLQ